jgi:hypothetical protein
MNKQIIPALLISVFAISSCNNSGENKSSTKDSLNKSHDSTGNNALEHGFAYPEIQKNGSSISNFAPNGWMVLDSATGDLNNDKNNDVAFVLQHRDSVSVVIPNPEDISRDTTVMTQPRILVIAFFNTTTKQYDLVEQSNTFILNHDDENMMDPFGKGYISISAGVLKISFINAPEKDMGASGGTDYQFRYQANEFQLVQAENSITHFQGATETRSYDFMTKKVEIATNDGSGSKDKVQWKTFDFKEMKTLKTLKEPYNWEIEKDVLL